MLEQLREVSSLLRGAGVHIGDLTAVLADRYGDRPAVEDDEPTPGAHTGGVRTFADLEEGVARLAGAYRQLGVERGTTVLVLVANRFDTVLHALALARIGALPAVANPRLTAHELVAAAAGADAEVAVLDPDVARRLDDTDDLGDLLWILTEPWGERADLQTVLGGDERPRVGPQSGGTDSPALLMFTSGTTGTPKAAALTSRGLLGTMGRLAFAPVGQRLGPRARRDRVLSALPLAHVMGFSVALGALCAGVRLLHRTRFDAAEVLDLVEQREPNVFVGVPTMYADLESAGAAQRDLGSVQLWISGADAMPSSRARRFQRYGAAALVGRRSVGTAAFVDVYGMVELSGPAAVRVYPPSLVRPLQMPPLSVTLPGIEVRAVDDEGGRVSWGEVGELQFRGASVLRGYAGGEDPTGGEGWFPTGDLGRVWPGGLFSFAGRRRDRLMVSGFSVVPAEVERELRRHPDVADVALVGLPDERTGERPVALVVAAAGFDADAFLSWAGDAVAGYRRPREVLVVDELPRGAHGKVDREEATRLAEQLTSGAA